MEVVYSLLTVILYFFLSCIIVLFTYFFVKSMFIVLRNRCKTKHSRKFKFKHKIYHIREARYIKPVDFVKLVIFDLVGCKDYLRLFGIWAFTGYYGEGKTMGCLQFAKHMQKNYPARDIKIFSNINIVGQTWVVPPVPCLFNSSCKCYKDARKVVSDWNDILDLPKNSIFIYDESQADFSCNMGNNAFPEDLLRRITQVRKKQFAMFMTSPRFNRMNINIRESVNFVIECKNRFKLDRWFSYVFYHAEDYEQYFENKIKLRLNRYLSFSFVTHNKDYRQYNTLERVESIKKEEDTKLKKSDGLMLQKELTSFKSSFRNEIIKEVNSLIKKIAS